MAKEYAIGFYRSKQWEKCRQSYIAYRRSVDGGLCESCRERPGYIVHHIRHITPSTINDPDVLTSFGNLQYVCLDCHNSIHYKKDAANIDGMVRYVFTPDGQVVKDEERFQKTK